MGIKASEWCYFPKKLRHCSSVTWNSLAALGQFRAILGATEAWAGGPQEAVALLWVHGWCWEPFLPFQGAERINTCLLFPCCMPVMVNSTSPATGKCSASTHLPHFSLALPLLLYEWFPSAAINHFFFFFYFQSLICSWVFALSKSSLISVFFFVL